MKTTVAPYASTVSLRAAVHWATLNLRCANSVLQVLTSRETWLTRASSQNPNVVSPIPEVKTITLTPRVGMLILGTDGVFDYWSDQQLVDFVSRYPAREGCDLSMKRRETSKSLNKDNATIIVVKFHWRVATPGTNAPPTSAP